jgi:translation initiation factor IF-2
MTKTLRPPIIVVLGHVDHGKTSLLDAIRKTRVTEREAGGITQGIGASVVSVSGKTITFLDTPGHAAFSGMRSRGAKLADLAVLVVSADDGVKPQTREALQAIREADIPFVVAITKIDLSTANIESALSQLEHEGVFFEKRGGDIPFIPLSSRTGEGIPLLLDTLLLLSEVHEVSSDSATPLEAVVIENGKDKRGVFASLVVRNGIIHQGDTVYVGTKEVKIRGIFDEFGKMIKTVLPGMPGLLLGFSEIPHVGTVVTDTATSEVSKTVSVGGSAIESAKVTIYLKAQHQGTLEALLANIPAGVRVISSGVGELIESDVLLAKTNAPDGIFLFDLKPASTIKKLADSEGVVIESFDIIYRLFERLTELTEKGRETVVAKATILTSFPFDGKRVAGAKLNLGSISMKESLRLMRGETVLGTVKVQSLRKQKSEVQQVSGGEEFGILFSPPLDFADGDVLVSVRNEP